ncbi:MAG: hypothetical protein ACJ74Y_14380 [Bryobacteraceae bacterium]
MILGQDDKPPLDELVHFGVKGMKWGVRKADDSHGYRLHAASPTIAASLHPSTKDGAKRIAPLMASRYGFQISDFKDLKQTNPAEYAYGTVGYVESTPGQRGGVVHMRPGDQRKELANAEKTGWFAEGTGNVNGFITHESAHALFHAEQEIRPGLFRQKVVGGNIDARNAALKAATKQAASDGIPEHLQISRVSGYAAASGSREELEAELFSQYHWNPNPPAFVKAWGETLHREMGIDATPFREVVKHG